METAATVVHVRWEEVAADLSDRWDSEVVADTEGEIAERLIAERARIRLVDRLAATVGRQIGIRVIGADWVRGSVVDVGPDWCLLRGAGDAETLVVLRAVSQVTGLGDNARDPETEAAVAARYGLAAVLRRLVDRDEVTVALAEGTRHRGRIVSVGADTLDLQRGSDPELLCCPMANLALLSWR